MRRLVLVGSLVVVPTACSDAPTPSGSSSSTESEGGGPDAESGGPDLPAACDLDQQDCDPGSKCVPAESSTDPGCEPMGTRCVAAEGSRGIGDFCALGEQFDDCGPGLYCNPMLAPTDLSPDCSSGVCTAACGSESPSPSATCEAAGLTGSSCRWPSPGSGPLYPLCVLACDPLAQDCEGGLGCYELSSYFGWHSCLPPAPVIAGEGEPCEGLTHCEPGLTCVPAHRLASCEGEFCCSAFCAVGDPMSACPGDGEVCDPTDSSVGVCRLP